MKNLVTESSESPCVQKGGLHLVFAALRCQLAIVCRHMPTPFTQRLINHCVPNSLRVTRVWAKDLLFRQDEQLWRELRSRFSREPFRRQMW